MPKIAALTLLVILVGGHVGPVRAGETLELPGSNDRAAEAALIRKMEDDRIQAGVRKDVDAIAAATADDYVQIDFDGTVRNKTEAMSRIRSSAIQLQANVVDDMLVRIYGDTAVVSGRATPKGTLNGRDYTAPMRYSRVYVKRDGRWQVVMFQLTRIAGDR